MDKSTRERYLRALGIERPIDVGALLGRHPRQILVVCSPQLGDTIVTLPAVQAIRDVFPTSRISVLVAGWYVNLIRAQNYIDDVDTLPRNDAEQGIAEQANDYELVLLFRPWSAEERSLPSGGPLKFVLFTRLFGGAPKLAHLHYLRALRLLGIHGRVRRPNLTLPEWSHVGAERTLVRNGFRRTRPLVAVHPGSGQATKRWPGERYAALLKRLCDWYDAQIVVVAGPAEAELARAVSAQLHASQYITLANRPLVEVAAVLSRCTLYVGNDSGIMHLADALRIPTITLYGHTRPEIWGPAGAQAVRVVPLKDCGGCPRCTPLWADTNIPSGRPCVNAIQIEDVLGAIESLVALAKLRDRFEHLDEVKVSQNFARRMLKGEALFTNVRDMRPFLVPKGARSVDNVVSLVRRYGSYSRAVGQSTQYKDVLDALLTYRVLLPARAIEPVVSRRLRKRRAELLAHPLIRQLSRPPESSTRTIEAKPSLLASRQKGSKARGVRRLRVLFTNTVDLATYGGGERWILSLARGLEARGHETLCWGLSSHRWLHDARGMRLTCISGPPPVVLDLSDLADRAASLKRRRLDAAILNMDRDVVALGPALRLAGVPLVIALKNSCGIDSRPIVRWAFSSVAHRIVAPCNYIRDELISAGWSNSRDISVIPNAIDTALFGSLQGDSEALRADLRLCRENRTIVTVGRLVEEKGTIHLLRALTLLAALRPNVTLVIVGRGPAETKLREAAKALGVDSKVRFAGERWDISQILALADCFVLPSLTEGVSLALLEAMASGLPVVATSVGGTPEVIVDGITGLLVPPGQETSLAHAMSRALDGGSCARMALAAREYVREHHHIERGIESIEELLLRAC